MSDNGKKISYKEAKELVINGLSIKKEYDGFIKGVALGAKMPERFSNFYASPFNAYIFDAELVTRFFVDGNKAKYLVVMIGASSTIAETDTAGGLPTVLLAGCNDGKNPNTYTTLNIDEPASQHPPKILMPDFPEAPNQLDDKSYSLTFLVQKK